jgi:glycogen synthase
MSSVATVTARPLRLLLVAPRFLPFMGGVELHVAEVARRLAAAGVVTTILTTDLTGELPPEESMDDVVVRRVRARPAQRDYYVAPGIYTEIARGDWDVVHVQGYHTFVAPMAMHAAVRARLPYVLTFHAGGHSSRLRHAVRPLQFALLRPLLARAERLVALAPYEIDRYSRQLDLPRESFALIPNGCDLPTVAAVGSAGDSALIGSIGRLERYKGHHRILEAFPEIARRRSDARLWLAGRGPYETQLRRNARRLGVEDLVEIRGVPAADRKQMAAELSRVKVAVLLSEFETQPIAALEALAAGCRLVVADTPGLSVLADDGLARRVPLGSPPEAVAAAVLEELERPRISDPPKLPTWDECADRLLDLYLSVTTMRRASPAPSSSALPARRPRASTAPRNRG